jgi:hypothetical protein
MCPIWQETATNASAAPERLISTIERLVEVAEILI